MSNEEGNMTRMTAKELEDIALVMRKYGIVDFATTDTRVILSANAAIPLPGAPVDPLQPIRPASTSPLDVAAMSDEEEDLLFASAT